MIFVCVPKCGNAGKVGELTTTTVFVRLGWDVKLKCDLGNASKSTNNSRPRW